MNVNVNIICNFIKKKGKLMGFGTKGMEGKGKVGKQ